MLSGHRSHVLVGISSPWKVLRKQAKSLCSYIVTISLIYDRPIGLGVSVSNNHAVAGSIPGTSTILKLD